ncbi:hypothetical protein V6N12_024283 [Hibiscus sabdariffa]|uniref:Uncharacterized protein n=1 Tax=Hibiscus sabdariffa TaxID=183260 RepID=A0ABR2G039_9ROSI
MIQVVRLCILPSISNTANWLNLVKSSATRAGCTDWADGENFKDLEKDWSADSSGFAADRPALPPSSLSVVTTWNLLCRLAGCCSGWSGLEERSLWMIRLAGTFPLRLGVSSAAVGGSAGAAPSDGSAVGVCWAGAGAGAGLVAPCWLLSWRMWRGAASSDWTGGGDGRGVGADPMGEAGVDCLLSCVAGEAAGVGAGLGALPTSAGWASAGADGPVSLGALAGLVDGVGSAILIGVVSATSIFRMYSFLDQPGFSAVYLSPGRACTAALRQRAVMMQGKARMPLLFWHAAAISWAMTSPTLKR